MSDENKQLLPNSVVDLLIFDTFKRNGADIAEPARTFSDEEKKMIRNLIADMQRQVDSFLTQQKKIEEDFKKAKFDPANLEYVNDLRKKEADSRIKEEKAKEAERRRNDPDVRKEQSIRELYAPSDGMRTSSRRTEAKEEEAKSEEARRRSRRRHRERRS